MPLKGHDFVKIGGGIIWTWAVKMTGRMIFSIFAKLRKLYFQRGLSLNSKHFEGLIIFNLIPRDWSSKKYPRKGLRILQKGLKVGQISNSGKKCKSWKQSRICSLTYSVIQITIILHILMHLAQQYYKNQGE